MFRVFESVLEKILHRRDKKFLPLLGGQNIYLPRPASVKYWLVDGSHRLKCFCLHHWNWIDNINNNLQYQKQNIVGFVDQFVGWQMHYFIVSGGALSPPPKFLCCWLPLTPLRKCRAPWKAEATTHSENCKGRWSILLAPRIQNNVKFYNTAFTVCEQSK